jgi:hypothetical protein
MATPAHPLKWELSCELEPAHDSDVKAVLGIGDDLLVTASRDSSVGVWRRSAADVIDPAHTLGTY